MTSKLTFTSFQIISDDPEGAFNKAEKFDFGDKEGEGQNRLLELAGQVRRLTIEMIQNVCLFFIRRLP